MLMMAAARPRQVVFLDANWHVMGVKSSFAGRIDGRVPVIAPTIEALTGIPTRVLDNEDDLWRMIRMYSVAQRMSWASRRSTTREEDEAYCLLGLFDISMPLLYGEGRKAFIRLQHEIFRHELDESMFAWGSRSQIDHSFELFARSPFLFAASGNVERGVRTPAPIFSSSGSWIELKVPPAPQDVVYVREWEKGSFYPHDLFVQLACGRWAAEGQKWILTPCVLYLASAGEKTNHLDRINPGGRGTLVFEDEVDDPGSCLPLELPGTWYIRAVGSSDEILKYWIRKGAGIHVVMDLRMGVRV